MRRNADEIKLIVGSDAVGLLRLLIRVAGLYATDAKVTCLLREVINVNVEMLGRLVGSRQFLLGEDTGAGDTACDVFRDEASNYASDVADWLNDTHWPECQAECAGILGGAGFSGPKWLKMSRYLYDFEMMAGSFTVSDSTIRGNFSGCKTLQKPSEETDSDFAEWLQAPSLGSEL